MAIEYEFTRINPLCTCDADGSNTKVHVLELSMRAIETGAGGEVFEAYENGQVNFSGDACVAPTGLNLSDICNDYATEQNWKESLASKISGQQEEPHEWTGTLSAPEVT